MGPTDWNFISYRARTRSISFTSSMFSSSSSNPLLLFYFPLSYPASSPHHFLFSCFFCSLFFSSFIILLVFLTIFLNSSSITFTLPSLLSPLPVFSTPSLAFSSFPAFLLIIFLLIYFHLLSS
jgi:hypothetical protein